MIKAMRDDGMSLRAISIDLEKRGVVMPRGGTKWTATAVKRALERAIPGTAAPLPKVKAR